MSKRETREASGLLRITVINKRWRRCVRVAIGRVACMSTCVRSGHRLEDSSRVRARVCTCANATSKAHYVCKWHYEAEWNFNIALGFLSLMDENSRRLPSRPVDKKKRANNLKLTANIKYRGRIFYRNIFARTHRKAKWAVSFCHFTNWEDKYRTIFLYLYCEMRLASLDLLTLYYITLCDIPPRL